MCVVRYEMAKFLRQPHVLRSDHCDINKGQEFSVKEWFVIFLLSFSPPLVSQFSYFDGTDLLCRNIFKIFPNPGLCSIQYSILWMACYSNKYIEFQTSRRASPRLSVREPSSEGQGGDQRNRLEYEHWPSPCMRTATTAKVI